MKNELRKKEFYLYGVIFLLLIFVHLPLFTKHILTADVILNNYFYNGYSWEISLGRFGLFIMGLLKSYLSIPSISLLISFLLILGSSYLLIELFDIKTLLMKIIFLLIMVLSPIISANLTFYYCSDAYLLAFFLSTLSLYYYQKSNHKTLKYLVPICLIIFSLSIYQAYFSYIITLFFIYQIKLILSKKISYKDSGIYFLLILGSVLIYFILMKLSLIVFHIDMASYSNANTIGLSTILLFPEKIIESYVLFYQMFFTDLFNKNIFIGNNIIYLLIGVLFLTTYFYSLFKTKISLKDKIFCTILVLLLPIFLNSVIFVIADSKLQLLMSSSYLLLFVFILSFQRPKYLQGIMILLFIMLLRNYSIQVEATYLSLENTYHTYDTIISTAINDHINELDKPFIVIGENTNIDQDIQNRNYGYLSKEGLFWDEYHLRKLGFTRFCKQTYGLTLTFGEEDIYNELKNNNKSDEVVYEYQGNIIINLYNA